MAPLWRTSQKIGSPSPTLMLSRSVRGRIHRCSWRRLSASTRSLRLRATTTELAPAGHCDHEYGASSAELPLENVRGDYWRRLTSGGNKWLGRLSWANPPHPADRHR